MGRLCVKLPPAFPGRQLAKRFHCPSLRCCYGALGFHRTTNHLMNCHKVSQSVLIRSLIQSSQVIHEVILETLHVIDKGNGTKDEKFK